MKSSVFYKHVLMFIAFSFLSFKCSNDDGPNMVEGDTNPPQISIINPDEGDLFFPDGSIDTPDYIIIEANASDESTITIGSASVYNQNNVEVYYYDETSATQNNSSITTIYSSFRTLTPGIYRIEFKFEDANGNVSTVSRNVECIFSEEGGTDLPG